MAKKKAAKKKVAKASKKKGAKKAAKKTKKKATKKTTRTTMYSSAGKKLYAVRAADGSFKDIQQYSKAHAQDIKRDAVAEN